MNVVVLIGTLSRAPEVRPLPAGSPLGTEVLTFDLVVRAPDGRSEPVPVSCIDPPPVVLALGEGAEVVVTGRVRRRFFRSGGLTQSRTDVLAEQIVPSRQAKRSRAALERAVALVGVGEAAHAS